MSRPGEGAQPRVDKSRVYHRLVVGHISFIQVDNLFAPRKVEFIGILHMVSIYPRKFQTLPSISIAIKQGKESLLICC